MFGYLKSPKIIGILIFTILSTFLSAVFPIKIYAAEQIDRYSVDIKIHKDASISVSETIHYNFGTQSRHGIFREIPKYITDKNGEKFKLIFSDIKVERGFASEPFSENSSAENFILKIGDAEKTITGKHAYKISYTVKGAITYFDDHDELYWNAIGNNWKAQIENASVQINLAELKAGEGAISSNDVQIVCYTGLAGSTLQNCSTDKNVPHVSVKAQSSLMPNEGLTFAVSFPRNLVDIYAPEKFSDSSDIFVGTIFVIMFALNIVLAVGIFLFWYFKGRDPKNSDVLVRMYDAPKDSAGEFFTPLELGTIVDEKINPQDISAEIVNLAIHKYIKIEEVESKVLGVFNSKEITLRRGQNLEKDLSMSNLKEHQRDLISALKLDKESEIKISQNTEIYSEILKMQKKLYERLTADGYFVENPDSVRTKYMVIGVLLFIFTLAVPGILVLIFSSIMPRKTLKGLEAKRHALGLKIFLESQDRHFEFQEKNFYLFEKLLPYAINFGVAKIWAQKFKDITGYNPDWYTTNSHASFNTFLLADSLQTNFNSFSGSYRGSSSSGFSGGSSGGGSGGGGGGSW